MIFKSLSVTIGQSKLVNLAKHTGKILFCLLAGLLMALLAACDVHEVKTKCGDYFRAGDLGNFDTSQSGLARDKKTETVWYRCPGGKTFLHHRCKGETVFATWDEAMAYAEEFSEKAGTTWRLPTKKEMKSIMESSCDAPTINTNVFPATEVANFWTSSSGLHQDQFRCAINTYNGSVSCRQIRTVKQPFMLVRD
jgi:hypothetical protein